MKMGNVVSLLHYDVAADQTIRPHNLRRTAILRYAPWTPVFPISRMVRLPFDCGHFDQSGDGVMGQFWTLRLSSCEKCLSRRRRETR
jgi:hypothetical protein